MLRTRKRIITNFGTSCLANKKRINIRILLVSERSELDSLRLVSSRGARGGCCKEIASGVLLIDGNISEGEHLDEVYPVEQL